MKDLVAGMAARSRHQVCELTEVGKSFGKSQALLGGSGTVYAARG